MDRHDKEMSVSEHSCLVIVIVLLYPAHQITQVTMVSIIHDLIEFPKVKMCMHR